MAELRGLKEPSLLMSLERKPNVISNPRLQLQDWLESEHAVSRRPATQTKRSVLGRHL
ncbi:hypothetical protein MPLDJ20_130080 [Mesorhizobium plurifarium]|uniref:Uncharacterized protein n=1 Tax=Mesorhizobium plurifarium TaxID=69974 RepID=A0A090EJ24_MESPL|nr:hypothetical protein MPLDJ20_130080 [Mesorhizobium plurifarium]